VFRGGKSPFLQVRESMKSLLSCITTWCSATKTVVFGQPPIVGLFVTLGLLSSPAASFALTPESPQVKAVVAKAVKFLETHDTEGWAQHPGAHALVGMCVLKHYPRETGKNQPKVIEAVQSIRSALANKGIPDLQQIYNIGLCLIFLLEAGHDEYRPEMEQLLAILLAAQKPHGGFGYPGQQTGDTSMHQYGCLGMWSCMMSGIPVPIDHWERAANWLLRTQDPKGGFGYQGIDPGSFSLVPQQEVRHSLSAAGLGSLGICASSLRLFAPDEAQSSSGPPQLKRVVKQVEALTKMVDPRQVSQALERGAGWFAANYTSDYKMDKPQFMYYYMYAMERYKSFLQEVDAKHKADNQWYDDGYALLAKTQDADGSWKTGGYHVPDTCFAVLFLMRSTQRAIEHAKTFGGGLLVGGRGLPDNASDIELAGGSVRAKALKGPAQELLQKLVPDDPNFEEALRGIEAQSLVEAGDHLTEMQKKLRSMAEGKSPEARAAAMTLLGRTRNLDHVPLLIEALKDPDPQVYIAAIDALRFMARKFSGSGVNASSEEEARKQTINQWKAWYLEIRPDTQFNDD